MDVRRQWAQFLGEYDWNYFITCRTPYNIYTRTVSTWIDKLYCNSTKVDKIFYVSERDKGDYNNLYVHMLLDTNTDMTYKEVRYGLGSISVGDYQPVYNNEEVCKYVTKHIGKDVDYDIVFKS
jgi:hypothetical protein